MFVVKECTKCNEYKLLDEFYRFRNGLFGFRSYCILCTKEYNKVYIQENKEYHKGYYQTRKDFREKRKKYNAKYRSLNKERINGNRRNRMKIDALFKFSCNIRTLISISIKGNGYKKKSKTHKILGCSFEEFKVHIESQFTKGMSWDNYGEWHFDHIYPVSLAKDEQHLIELNHYTNFQPLWAADNIRKGNKIVEKQLKLL